MNCLNCGKKTLEGQDFCEKCKKKLEKAKAPIPPPGVYDAPTVPASTPEAAAHTPATKVEEVAEPTPTTTAEEVTEPTEPANPEKPTEPADTEQPTKPANTEQPTEPAKTEQPTEPTPVASAEEPAKPGGPFSYFSGKEGADQTKTTTSSKKTLRITAIVVAIVLVVGVGIFAGSQALKSVTYANAVSLMEEGSYSEAYDKFVGLNEYEEAAQHAEFCMKALEFESAEALLYEKKYSEAQDAFKKLGSFMDADKRVLVCDGWIAFTKAQALTEKGAFDEAFEKAKDFNSISEVKNASDVKEWNNQNNYGRAGLRYNEGRFYDAYTLFTGLGSYKDASDRAQSCIQAPPGTGEMYHNEGFVSSATHLQVDAGAAQEPYFLKVYSGDTHVSSLFINPGTSTTIYLPAGEYSFKGATGGTWFDDQGMFGKDGYYYVMLFNGSDESVRLENNMIYTVTLYTESDGNVGGKSVDRENF